jgi:FkbM family methyltransferase
MLANSVRLFFYRNVNQAVRSASWLLRRAGNELFKHAFSVYFYLYRAYKACADRAERRLLSQVLSLGDVVIDGGANIGIYAEFLSRCIGPTGVIHAFEPSPVNFARLRAITQKLPNVQLCQAAIGEYTGKSTLYISNHLNVDHRTYPVAEGLRHTIPVEIVAIDDYITPGQRIDLIKLDVQGFELHALRGAARVLHDNPGLKLLIEFWPYGLRQAGVEWRELPDMLRDFGMELFLVKTDRLQRFETNGVQSDASWYVNLFATRGHP